MDDLVRRLRSGSLARKLQALHTLVTTCEGNPEVFQAAAAAGVIPVLYCRPKAEPPGGGMDDLVRRLRSGSLARKLQALYTLVAVCKGNPEVSRAAAAAGAIPVLVQLLRSSQWAVQALVAGAIHDWGTVLQTCVQLYWQPAQCPRW
ncbi:hypothetical protein ABPG77_010077 [Micractinium sp. CCAP 211/92]